MRVASPACSYALLGLLAACSGGKIVDFGDAASPSTDAPDDTTMAPPTGTDAAVPPPPGADSGPDCNALSAQIQSIQQQAETCCPICNPPQCNVAVQGVCCPFSVTGTPPSGFDALVAQYKAECHPACPAIACQMEPSNKCQTSDPTNPAAMGTCR